MNRSETKLDLRIRRALDARARIGIPEGVDLWPRVHTSAVAHRRAGSTARLDRHSGRQLALIAVVFVALLTSGIAAAAAASPSLREFLQQTVPGIHLHHFGEAMDSTGRPLAIQPLPPFRLFYPRSLPKHLPYHEIGQSIPGRDGTGRGYVGGGGPVPRRCLATPTRCLDASQVFGEPPSLLGPFERRAARVVWFGFGAPDLRFIQIAEWDAAASPVKSLTRAGVAPPNPRKPDSLLVLAKGRTTIAIETNLGPAEARRIASSLRALILPAQ